jgi:hypothetical protein
MDQIVEPRASQIDFDHVVRNARKFHKVLDQSLA